MWQKKQQIKTMFGNAHGYKRASWAKMTATLSGYGYWN